MKNDDYFRDDLYDNTPFAEEPERFAMFTKSVYTLAKYKVASALDSNLTGVENLTINNKKAAQLNDNIEKQSELSKKSDELKTEAGNLSGRIAELQKANDEAMADEQADEQEVDETSIKKKKKDKGYEKPKFGNMTIDDAKKIASLSDEAKAAVDPEALDRAEKINHEQTYVPEAMRIWS